MKTFEKFLTPTVGDSWSPSTKESAEREWKKNNLRGISAAGTSQTEPPQSDQLTLSLEDSPARTSVTQEKAPVSRASGQDYGQSLPELLARYDPDGPCWRTSQRCLVEGWTVLRETWPRSGMTVNGTAYQLQPLAPLTGGTGFGSLPTHSIPTPTVGDSRGSGSRNTENSKANPGVSLTDYVRGDQGTGRLWPTPAAHEGRLGYQDRTSGKKGKQISLTTSVMNSEGRKPQEEWAGGQLNPTWVEWLMGFPIGWTDLED